MNIGFIGAGAMAEAIIQGILSSGIVLPEEISCSDISKGRRDYIQKTYGTSVYVDNVDVIRNSNLLIIAVKPHLVEQVTMEMKDLVSNDKIIISIAAGITTSAIESWLGGSVPVIRVMPNTPCLIGEGVSALCFGKYAKGEHGGVVRGIFESVGSVVEIPENLMNPVTGVSGSGPAYIYLIIEAMVDAGVALGLQRSIAEELVTKTIIGAARMVKESGEHPAVLKAKVVSPGGTTAAALKELEAYKVRTAFDRAISASCLKSFEIGK